MDPAAAALKLPVEPIHLPVHQPLGLILPRPGPPGVYVAGDGTPLNVVNAADGQITGFSGMERTATTTRSPPG